MREFRQRKGLNSRKYTLTKNSVLVEYKNIHKITRYEVRFDKIGLETFYHAENVIVGKIFTWFCLLLLIFMLTLHFGFGMIEQRVVLINSVIFGGMAIFSFLKQNKDDIFLTGGQTNIVFYRNKPNEEAVLHFIEEIKSEVKQYLMEKYTRIDDTISEQEYFARLNWLLEKDIISQKVFEQYKSQYNLQKLM